MAVIDLGIPFIGPFQDRGNPFLQLIGMQEKGIYCRETFNTVLVRVKRIYLQWHCKLGIDLVFYLIQYSHRPGTRKIL